MKTDSITHLILLPVVFFLCIPALCVEHNIQDIAYLDYMVFVVLAGFAFIFLCVFLLANTLFRKSYLSFVLGSGAEFLCFFIVLTGFVIPASVSTGMVDPELVPIDKPNLFMALGLAGLMSWVARSKHKQTLYAVLVLFVVLNTILSSYVVFSKLKSHHEAQNNLYKKSLHTISDERNIFVLSFDGISGSAAREVLNENAELSSLFDGFTLFSNVTSSSPATAASTATSLYGNQDFKTLYQTESELWDAAPDDLLTNYLNASGYDVSTFGIYNKNFIENKRKHVSTNWSTVSVSELVNLTIARTLTSTYAISKKRLDWLDHKVRTRLFDDIDNKNSLLWKISHSSAPKWKRGLAATILDMNEYTKKLVLGSRRPVAHFMHFTFTHYPVEFDRDCNYLGHEIQWFANNQTRYSVKEETYCALTIFADYLSKLKAMGIFQKSMIVLKSDHGKPVDYYEPGDLEAAKINEHDLWGLGRYAPFLATKGFDSTAIGLQENNSPVMLDDLARTICTAALNDAVCEKYPGYDLMDETSEIPETATATLFVVRSRNSNYKYDTHKAVTVNRQPHILRNLYNTLKAEKSDY